MVGIGVSVGKGVSLGMGVSLGKGVLLGGILVGSLVGREASVGAAWQAEKMNENKTRKTIEYLLLIFSSN